MDKLKSVAKRSTNLLRCLVILIRCRLFLNQLLTCVMVRFVSSANFRLSSNVGYGFSLYALPEKNKNFVEMMRGMNNQKAALTPKN